VAETAPLDSTDVDVEQAETALALTNALALVHAAGYVTVRAKSYRQAQERQRVAEARLACELEQRESTERWAGRAFDEQRRLADRLTFVYGEARARGASADDLAGPAARNEATGRG
jgi:hypothetical protein